MASSTPPSVYARVLERAAELLGGRHQLRSWLRVSMREIDVWLAGEHRPPVHVFLQAVDLISAAQSPRTPETGQARELPEQARRLRAALLDNAPGWAARRQPLSVQDFLAAEFAPSDAGLIVDNALNAVVNGTAAARANVQLVSEDGLRIVGHLGFQQPFLDFFANVGHDTPSTCGAAAKAAKRIVVSDVESDAIFAGTHAGEVMLQAGARACVSTPILDPAGQLVGMLSTHYEAPHEPPSDELEAIDVVCRRASFWLGGA